MKKYFIILATLALVGLVIVSISSNVLVEQGTYADVTGTVIDDPSPWIWLGIGVLLVAPGSMHLMQRLFQRLNSK